MSAKSKIFFILILSIFATISASAIFYSSNSSTLVNTTQNAQAKQIPVAIEAADITANPERAKYKTIPLESIKSALKGTDPASLAMDVFDTSGTERKTRKVEVAYPQSNQALVTITQKDLVKNSRNAVRYRVELSSFGRTILATSPPMWQIVWVGKRNSNE
jgi:acid phosphatase class B